MMNDELDNRIRQKQKIEGGGEGGEGRELHQLLQKCGLGWLFEHKSLTTGCVSVCIEKLKHAFMHQCIFFGV